MILRITQKALIWNKGKFLILKRAKHDCAYPEHWDFPGGGLELEHPIEGIKREVREEANLEVKNLEPIHTYAKTIQGKYKVFIIWKCNYKSGNVKLSDEHTEFKWIKKKDLKTLKKLEPYIKDMIEKGKL